MALPPLHHIVVFIAALRARPGKALYSTPEALRSSPHTALAPRLSSILPNPHTAPRATPKPSEPYPL